ncbi:Hypothetical predicted protein [Cloeon dipterum]|uniref:Uncharacterized protein n=1 Tax=Cloeon dipterum TaxID=197152 RepID=A0A8S1E8W0_9INSE|nr:Hypothetical predicted protein [Cloeon dipterum]
MTQRSTSADICRSLNTALVEFGVDVDQVISTCTDRGANVLKACKDLFGENKVTSCVCHLADNVVQDSLYSLPIVNALLKDVKQIVKDCVNRLKTHDSEMAKIEAKLHEERKENSDLTKQINSLKEKVAQLEGKISKIRENASKKLTAAQTARLLDGKKPNYGEADYELATRLYAEGGAKAYDIVRVELKMPVPSISSLQRYLSGMDFSPGFLKPSLSLLKIALPSLPRLYLQVVLVRGLFSNWSTAIYYNFSTPTSKELVEAVLREAHTTGLTVAALVCDMGSSNVGALKNMGKSKDKPHFTHPVTGKHVFCFYDAPHLLKQARNHLPDEGGIQIQPEGSKDRVTATRGPIDELLANSSTYEMPSHNILASDLHVQGYEKQKVDKAVRLLSKTTSSALLTAGNNGLLVSTNYAANATYCRILSSFFSIFNTRPKSLDEKDEEESSDPCISPFGRCLEHQEKIL